MKLLLSILLCCLPAGCIHAPNDSLRPLRVVEEIPLLEGNGMGRWRPMPIRGAGPSHVENGILTIDSGSFLNGVVWQGEPPARINYEIELEARKVSGFDFFLGLTVPVGDSYCTWICGGWGGSVVGISSIDGLDAGANETSLDMDFEEGHWYRCRMRVLADRIQCWIDDKCVIDVNIRGRKISLRPGDIEQAVPLGIATYDTEAEYRNIVWRNLAVD